MSDQDWCCDAPGADCPPNEPCGPFCGWIFALPARARTLRRAVVTTKEEAS